jgi:hypothetical protein
LLLRNDGDLLRPHLKEEEILLVLETCSPYISKPDDHELELGAPDRTEEQKTSIHKHSEKGKTGLNQNVPGDSTSYKQSMTSGITVAEGRQNPDMSRVIQLLWSKPSIRSMVKELQLQV